MRLLSQLFAAAAILLSDIMCAVVAYNYCSLEWGGKYVGYSAPANTAFICAIPYAIGILICAGLAWLCGKKVR